MNDLVVNLLTEYLTRRQEGEEDALEKICAAHPEHAEELRKLKEDYERHQAIYERIGLNPYTQATAAERSATARQLREARQLHDQVVRRLASRGSPVERLTDEGKIAQGGMGVIRRVVDEDLRRTLAMKVLRDDEAAAGDRVDPSKFSRFLDEAQVTAQLDHPGIVPVHELGLDAEGQVYFTMKLVKGKTLSEVYRLAQTPGSDWSQTRVLGVLLQVCQAMAYAHDKKVIHRDLKPSNIMVGRYGEVYVMDWGLARMLDGKDPRDLRMAAFQPQSLTMLETDRRDHAKGDSDSPLYTMDGAVVGTPAYMPPEQAKGALDQLGPRSDIYSVGAMLYQLMSGRKPYVPADERIDPYAVVCAIQQGPPRPIHELAPKAPAELMAICEKAMAREPEDRYASMSDLADNLRSYLEHRVVSAYETGALAELKKWVVRNPSTAAAMAAALVAIIGGLVFSVYSQQRVVAAQDRLGYYTDFLQLDYLVDEFDLLWPATPERAPAMENWVREARELLERRYIHEERLHLAGSDDAALGDRGPEQVLARMDILAGGPEEPGYLERMVSRIELAQSLEEMSVSGPDARGRWAEARASIASPGPDNPYGAYDLKPQLGLLPLGRNEATGLWEFAHVASGKLPDWAGDRWRIREDTCVVLVLIPAMTFSMGDDVDRELYNSRGDRIPLSPKEGPRHEVQLKPFFLSKYELSQGQWLSVERTNPAFWKKGNLFGDKPFDRRHPVENIDWEDADRVARHMDLVLPTESQWEGAMRAGTDTLYWTGDDYLSLAGDAALGIECGANLLDSHARDNGGPPGWPYEREFDDGYTTTAPVDLFRPNNFGLHNMTGNVWEWTRDYFDSYQKATPRPGDGFRDVDPTPTHSARGGAFYNDVSAMRASYRFEVPGFRVAYGVRMAREVEE